ncbi:MAG: chemotaxis protein CheW [Lachnospiraceae bacterium]|nr:chemotaxis protein CheW [Lachnospiraceae bacterium]
MADEVRITNADLIVDEGEKVQYIVIKLGNEQYGIDIKYIDNIIRMQSITRVPHVPNYIKGVINVRGEVIPVLNLRLKMGLDEIEDTKASRIIILKLEQFGLLGFIVDEVKEVVTLSEIQIEKVAYDGTDEKQNFVFGVGKTDTDLISLLDMNVVCAENGK